MASTLFVTDMVESTWGTGTVGSSFEATTRQPTTVLEERKLVSGEPLEILGSRLRLNRSHDARPARPVYVYFSPAV